MKMRIFDLFRKKRKMKARKRRRSKSLGPKARPTMKRIEADMENLQSQIGTVNIALKKHDDQLSEHDQLIRGNSKTLEQIANALEAPPLQRETNPTPQPVAIANLSTIPAPAQGDPGQKLDINRFSEQEKRILSVFFHNRGVALSYADVAQYLNKSHYTVKNQMAQIRQKADLFEKTVGRQCRNMFKLKDDLRVEKYLNLSQPIEPPVSTSWAE